MKKISCLLFIMMLIFTSQNVSAQNISSQESPTIKNKQGLMNKQSNPKNIKREQNFRLALSLGQGVEDTLQSGYVFQHGDTVATNATELQQLYINAGANEMFVRINTKRYNDGEITEDPYHAELLSLESGLKKAELAAKLNIPINPEIMVAHTYMDSFSQQSPNFKDYPEIDMPDKPWSQYSLEEMNDVLTQYGELVATAILETGADVEYWNIGNEANFGFGGVNVGLKTAVNPELENKNLWDMLTLPSYGTSWLKENVWNYNGQMMAAVAEGIKNVDPEAKFSTHITTSIADTTFITTYFKTLSENGFTVDQAGISFYPTSMSYLPNPVQTVKEMITSVNKEMNVPVFIAEYAYPSEEITSGPFQDWDAPILGYEVTEQGQSQFTADFIKWSMKNGVSGIRPWAPDLAVDHWGPMSLFTVNEENKIAEAKPVLDVYQKYFTGCSRGKEEGRKQECSRPNGQSNNLQ